MRGFLLIRFLLPVRPMRNCAKPVKIAQIAGIPPHPRIEYGAGSNPLPQEREHLAALQKILLLAIKVMHVSP